MDLTSVTLEIWRMLEVCCIALAFLVPLKKKESRWVRRAVICIALGGLVFLGMPVVIAHFPFMACVDEFSSADAFLVQYRQGYDLIFLDIEFPHGKSGMDAARALRRIDSAVVII